MTETKREQSGEDVIHHKYAGWILGFRMVTNIMKAEVRRLQKEGEGKKDGEEKPKTN